MAQFQITRPVTFAVEAETEEDAHAQAEQWHGLAAKQHYEALAQMASSVKVTPTGQGGDDFSMSTGI